MDSEKEKEQNTSTTDSVPVKSENSEETTKEKEIVKIVDEAADNNSNKSVKPAVTEKSEYSEEVLEEAKIDDLKSIEKAKAAKRVKREKTPRQIRAAEKRKKIFKIVGNAVWVLLMIVIGYILVGSIYSNVNDKDFYLFNQYTFSVVQTDSMTPEINVGDFVVCQKVNIDDVEVGDDVMYVSRNMLTTKKYMRICHRVIEKQTVNGETQLITQGIKITNGVEAPVDSYPVTSDNIVGVKVFTSSAFGNVFQFLTNIFNWLFIAALAITIYLIVSFVKKIYKDGKLT